MRDTISKEYTPWDEIGIDPMDLRESCCFVISQQSNKCNYNHKETWNGHKDQEPKVSKPQTT